MPHIAVHLLPFCTCLKLLETLCNYLLLLVQGIVVHQYFAYASTTDDAISSDAQDWVSDMKMIMMQF